MKQVAAIVLALIVSTNVLAHTSVDSTEPKNGAVLANPPSNIKLNFENKIRLTRVSQTFQTTEPAQLDIGQQRSFSTTFSFPFQNRGNGKYVIQWRGLGTDGHTMQGEFSFMVD